MSTINIDMSSCHPTTVVPGMILDFLNLVIWPYGQITSKQTVSAPKLPVYISKDGLYMTTPCQCSYDHDRISPNGLLIFLQFSKIVIYFFYSEPNNPKTITNPLSN